MFTTHIDPPFNDIYAHSIATLSVAGMFSVVFNRVKSLNTLSNGF